MSARPMRLLCDVAIDLVDRLEQKIFKSKTSTTETDFKGADAFRVRNVPRHEWLFDCLSGKPKAEQKRLIMQARHPSIGFLNDDDVDVLISALGLGGA